MMAWNGIEHVEYPDEDRKDKFGLSKKSNAVSKKYLKPLNKIDSLNDKILKIFEEQMNQLNPMKNDPTYNVRLHGYMDILEIQFTATQNLISEIRYDLARNNYKEGEE